MTEELEFDKFDPGEKPAFGQVWAYWSDWMLIHPMPAHDGEWVCMAMDSRKIYVMDGLHSRPDLRLSTWERKR